MKKSYSFKCPTCGKTYFTHVYNSIECYGCSYDRNAPAHRYLVANK